MKKLILLVMLISGVAKAQTFDFSCDTNHFSCRELIIQGQGTVEEIITGDFESGNLSLEYNPIPADGWRYQSLTTLNSMSNMGSFYGALVPIPSFTPCDIFSEGTTIHTTFKFVSNNETPVFSNFRTEVVSRTVEDENVFGPPTYTTIYTIALYFDLNDAEDDDLEIQYRYVAEHNTNRWFLYRDHQPTDPYKVSLDGLRITSQYYSHYTIEVQAWDGTNYTEIQSHYIPIEE